MVHGLLLHGQSNEEKIQSIREAYAHVYEDLIPNSSKVRLLCGVDGAGVIILEDQRHNWNFTCIDVQGREEIELYFYRTDKFENWQLIKIFREARFADGFDSWRTQSNYYFKDQQLFFAYEVTVSTYDEGEAEMLDYESYRYSRSENRHYFSDGQLIRHLRKVAEIDSPEELIDYMPSYEVPVKDNNHYEWIQQWVSGLLDSWGGYSKKDLKW